MIIQVALDHSVQAPMMSGAADEVGDQLLYPCDQCGLMFNSVPNLRRHCTKVHLNTRFRSVRGLAAACAVNGLPQCVFCHKFFTHCRHLQHHLDRQCCQVSSSALPFNMRELLRDEEALRIQRETQPLTEHLLTKPYGDRLLRLVQDRAWNDTAHLRAACEDLTNHCACCDFSSRGHKTCTST